MDKLAAKLKRPRRRYGKSLRLGSMLAAILAIGLSMLSNTILPAHSHSQVTGRLSDLDKARVAEVFHLRRELGDTLWPGWDQADIPVTLYNEEYAFLTMYPDPPPGWLKMPEHSRHGGPWEPVLSDTLEGQTYYRQRLPSPDDTPEAFTVLVGERWVASMATKEWMKIEFGNQIRNGLPPLLNTLFPFRMMARLILSVHHYQFLKDGNKYLILVILFSFFSRYRIVIESFAPTTPDSSWFVTSRALLALHPRPI